MKASLLTMLICCLSAGTGSGLAADSRKIAEVTIGVEPFQALFVDTGIGADLPQLLVYAPSGKCIGTLDHTAQGRLDEAIGTLLESPKSGCQPFLSTEFGAAAPSAATGPGRITVQLLVFDGDFCVACANMEEEFRQLADSNTSHFWRLTRVSLDTAFNQTKEASGRDCAHCQEQRSDD